MGVLIAFGQLQSLLCFGNVLLCLFIVGWALSAVRARPGREFLRPGWGSVLVVAALVWLGVWLTLVPVITLGVWMFWLGDNNHWFWDWIPHVAAGGALGAAGLVAVRLAAGPVSRRAFRVLRGSAVTLVAIWGLIYLSKLIGEIDGLTAASAAQNIADRMEIGEPVHVVEDPEGNPFGADAERCRTFLVMDADEPRGRVKVCRRSIGWGLASSTKFPRSAD
jgi:hypothetical protein